MKKLNISDEERKERKRLALYKWRKSNPEKRKEIDTRHKETHREEINTRHREYAKKIKKLVFEAYGGICHCCGESDTRFLTIDHINNDGAKLTKNKTHPSGGYGFYAWIVKNRFPDNLQILCWNCNCGKRMNNGVCPHKEVDIL
jgi:hypothetical protein